MYHCNIQFYFIGCQNHVFEVIKKQPPLERFTHNFLESEVPESVSVAQADVILFEWQEERDREEFQALTTGMKEEAQLILLCEEAQLWNCVQEQSKIHDIWMSSMTEQEIVFRFRKWQKDYKLAKDYWEYRQYLDAAINSNLDLVWYKDKDGIHKKVNDSFCEAAGKSRQDVEGQTYTHIWNAKQDDPSSIRLEQEVMEQRKTCVADEVFQTSEGERLLKTYKSPLYDLDGSVMGTISVGIDVTRERASEKEIIEKNQVLEQIFATTECGVMYHSLDGKRIISVNQAALQLLDYNSQQELLADGFDLVAPSVVEEDKQNLLGYIKSLEKPGDSVTMEYRVRHKDGKVLHILGNVKLVETDGELFYQRFLLDITAQKQKDQAQWDKKDWELRYQEQLFEIFSTFLADNIDDIYMMFDERGEKVEFVTSNIERVLGVSPEAVMDDMKQLGRVKYLTRGKVSYEELAALELGMSLEPMETERINQKTGEHKWFRESVYCVSLQGVKKIIVYISDRTKERKVQDTLTAALEMAEVANKAKTTFLSSVSHDIRTPMNAIMGFTALLRDDANNPEHVLDYTKKISAASTHLLGLINDVLDMNKIESGSSVLNISELNLADMIDEMNSIIRPQVRLKNQSFNIHATSLTCEHLLGDKLRINQILINILSNAVKYTQDGGKIEMRIRELPRVDKSYSRLQFVISDNGRGMSKEYQRVIFDPFTREQETFLNPTQGTGLGMAITKSLVDLMGGTIKVESELGKGTTFTVELDLRIQNKEDDLKFWDRNGITRMIVADDDEMICHDIIKKMESTGVKVDYVTDGAQVVKTIRAARLQGEPYDLILLDWKMPGYNVVETARLIQENYRVKAPILLFSAYDWADIEEEAGEVGIEHFLPKPFFMSNFKDTIQRMMEGKKTISISGDGESVVTGKHILVVDDIDVNRIILVKILTTLGAVCEEAIDGLEAVEKFQASKPGEYDIILMDVQMPGMNGYEATRVIRASKHPSAQSVVIIAMTANAFIDDIRDALESGMDAHVSKPVELNQLKSTVKVVLERKRIMQD